MLPGRFAIAPRNRERIALALTVQEQVRADFARRTPSGAAVSRSKSGRALGSTSN